MQNDLNPQSVSNLLGRLVDATNTHDVDGIVQCFAEDYVNETPAHPLRGFRGREQVRRNWTRILAAVPDLRVELLKSTVDGNTAWTEWEHRGTRLDGSVHLLRGVVIFTVSAGLLARVRFYLEEVEHATGNMDAAIDRIVRSAPGGDLEEPS
ncbi:MAG TPA: nuclear transport factor 2 family protein [Glaciibacter sp.]|nr:nuclear transport factor 2 family protein [Glaciibacter sp.]